MNTAPPPARDLPAARHAELRAAVLAEIAPRPARRWLAPLVTAAAALVVVGLGAWFIPWGSDAPAASLRVASNQDVAAVERECLQLAEPEGALERTFAVRQVLVAEADVFVVVGDGETMMFCVNDWGGGSSGAKEDPHGAPVTFDFSTITTVDGDSGRSVIFAGGMISPRVAKVTLEWAEHSVDAELGNGTYLARLTYPNLADSENPPLPVVRAYDKNGTLLAEVGR